MNIIGKKTLFLSIAGILVALSIFLIFVFGFEEAIDFKGGTLWQFQIPQENPSVETVSQFLKSDIKEIGETVINYDLTHDTFLVRLRTTTEDEHQKLQTVIKTKFPSFEELSFQSIGPSIGANLRKNAVKAIIFAIIFVSLYISFAFRKVSRPITSWKYGVVTMISLLHDIVIPAGLIAVLGHYLGVEIDSNFIVALLVIMGFSVHDTIVVFDRIRENLSLDRGKTEFGTVINNSINQTMARSINTSLTLIIVLLAMFFLGPINLKYFTLTLLVGVSMGVYSSIFVASPLLLVWHNLTRK
ncbi:MAG: protein translocase subunit SecF [Patescibacteria group bacterium]